MQYEDEVRLENRGSSRPSSDANQLDSLDPRELVIPTDLIDQSAYHREAVSEGLNTFASMVRISSLIDCAPSVGTMLGEKFHPRGPSHCFDPTPAIQLIDRLKIEDPVYADELTQRLHTSLETQLRLVSASYKNAPLDSKIHSTPVHDDDSLSIVERYMRQAEAYRLMSDTKVVPLLSDEQLMNIEDINAARFLILETSKEFPSDVLEQLHEIRDVTVQNRLLEFACELELFLDYSHSSHDRAEEIPEHYLMKSYQLRSLIGLALELQRQTTNVREILQEVDAEAVLEFDKTINALYYEQKISDAWYQEYQSLPVLIEVRRDFLDKFYYRDDKHKLLIQQGEDLSILSPEEASFAHSLPPDDTDFRTAIMTDNRYRVHDTRTAFGELFNKASAWGLISPRLEEDIARADRPELVQIAAHMLKNGVERIEALGEKVLSAFMNGSLPRELIARIERGDVDFHKLEELVNRI